MEISFWYLVLAGGLVTWTTCTFLRAVATRTQQMRAQVLEQLLAAKAAEEAAEEEGEEVGAGGDGAVATVLNVPSKSKPAGKTSGNGKPSGQSNGKSNGHVAGKRPGR
jgi:hypothetical protein